jgi:hypothetical protein
MLAQDYFQAIQRLPALVCAAAGKIWDEDFMRIALSVLAVGKGFPVIAEATMELTADLAQRFLDSDLRFS